MVYCSWSSTVESSELSSSVCGPRLNLDSGQGWTGPTDLRRPGKDKKTGTERDRIVIRKEPNKKKTIITVILSSLQSV